MLPLYGFLEGDALGLVILVDERETVQELADKLRQAARVRVASRDAAQVWYKGERLSPEMTMADVGIQALERFDVTQSTDVGHGAV